MNEFIIGLPIKSMKQALAALDTARNAHDAIDEEKAALPALNAVDDGMKAMKKREDDLAAFAARKREASERALTAIQTALTACIDAIDAQTIPTGADITGANEGDFRLLEYGLVNSPATLEKLAAAHDVPAFRAMVQRYAKERGWEGFAFSDKEALVRKFADDFFSLCSRAANAPRGYYGLLLEQDAEIERQALASGLADEYRKGLEANL